MALNYRRKCPSFLQLLVAIKHNKTRQRRRKEGEEEMDELHEGLKTERPFN